MDDTFFMRQALMEAKKEGALDLKGRLLNVDG